ncbi:MAG: monooxygenase [Gemmatimonadetes bacterium]|nr:MAG: monooxygenase [Gemmatimonadota bacterium]
MEASPRPDPTPPRVCVVGAGSSGLAAGRNLAAVGLPFDILEQCPDLGGNWNYGLPVARVYESTHTISSKPGTEYPDFPMPDDYPDYPHHTQILAYLRAYAEYFGLLEHIEFGRRVERIAPTEARTAWGDPMWEVRLDGGETRRYEAVVIANGHNWDPKVPEYPGTFNGEQMHSAEYRTPEVLRGRRVLVVGGGNSGCDIVVEAAHIAERAFHSTRRGYHYVPKYLWGRPSDQIGDLLHRLHLPMGLQRFFATASLRLAVGRPEKLGLPKPDHRLFETHPIVNSLLPYYVRHGAITPKPDIERLDGDHVVFSDGSRERVDLILWATGYNIRFPFIDPQLLAWADGRPHLFRHVFHPEYDNLFVAGLIQPDSGQFGIVHWQCRALALFLAGVAGVDGVARPKGVERLRHLKRGPDRDDLGGGLRYKDSTRHYLEIEHWSYTRGLRRLARMLDA